MDKQLLTPTEATAALGLGRSVVYQLLMSGQLASITIGRSRRIPVGAIEEFVRGRLRESRENMES